MISVELLLVGPYPVKAELSMRKLAFSSAWGPVPAPNWAVQWWIMKTIRPANAWKPVDSPLVPIGEVAGEGWAVASPQPASAGMIQKTDWVIMSHEKNITTL